MVANEVVVNDKAVTDVAVLVCQTLYLNGDGSAGDRALLLLAAVRGQLQIHDCTFWSIET